MMTSVTENEFAYTQSLPKPVVGEINKLHVIRNMTKNNTASNKTIKSSMRTWRLWGKVLA